MTEPDRSLASRINLAAAHAGGSVHDAWFAITGRVGCFICRVLTGVDAYHVVLRCIGGS